MKATANSPAFRWVETATGASGLLANQIRAGVGMSSRIPWSLAVRAITAKDWVRITSLYAGGADEVDLKRLMHGHDTIETAEIITWFDEWLTPEESDLQDLASALNIMVTVRKEDTADDSRSSRRAVKKDIPALLKDLPALIAIERQTFELRAIELAKSQRGEAIEYGLMFLKKFDDLLSAAQQADKVLGHRAPRRREAPWFGDALWIATFLRMLGEKAGRPIGLTKADCPGVRFIKRALERACPAQREDNDVNEESIARAMARHKELIAPWKWKPPEELNAPTRYDNCNIAVVVRPRLPV